MKKIGAILSFSILAFILSAFAGAVVWVILRIMNLGIYLLWEMLPQQLGMESSIIYNLILCIVGGAIIGLWQMKYGLLPDNMEQVMGKIRREGFYPYGKLHVIAVSALLPLIFGGALGPEAGLTGLIVGLCYFVGDRLKYKADKMDALAETGMASVLGVLFGAPFFGIVGNLEPEKWDRAGRKRLADKKTRVFVYVVGVIGALLAMMCLTHLFGGGSGLPRFNPEHEIGFSQWRWFPLMLITGLLFGIFYMVVDKLTSKIGKAMISHRVISCMIAGAAVAILGHYLPFTMFSGEHEMGDLMFQWQSESVMLLMFSGIGKVLLVNICINFGWRGGNIFPLIFAGTTAGYAVAAVIGMDGSMAVAIVVAAMYAYMVRKPLTVVAVLLLCFPITYIPPIFAAAFIGAKIPIPGFLKRKEDE